jgi:hypothetical protein
VVAAVVLAAVVAGCSAEPEPTPEAPPSAPSSSEAPAVEPTPTPEAFTAPQLPEAATTPDAAGAEAFVRYFWDTVNYAYTSGDTAAIWAISHVDCAGCAGVQENIKSATVNGATWRDLSFTIEQLEVAEPDSDGLSFATGLLIRSANPTVREADGTLVPVEGPEVEGVRFWTQWTGNAWQTFAINYPDRAQ